LSTFSYAPHHQWCFTMLVFLKNWSRHCTTPAPLIENIKHGFMEWLHPSQNRVTATTFGSIKGPDILATMAFYDQYAKIGWYQFCLGRISKNWAMAFNAYQTPSHHNAGLHWSSQLIASLWIFTRKMWAHRNQIIHGATASEAATNEIRTLQEKISSHYTAYETNSNYGINISSHSGLYSNSSQCHTMG
jgi:hypothetical protein